MDTQVLLLAKDIIFAHTEKILWGVGIISMVIVGGLFALSWFFNIVVGQKKKYSELWKNNLSA